MFGSPGISHKFVKGLKDREGLEIYRKSGTWKDFHGDSGVFVRDGLVYIAVAINEREPKGGRGYVESIRVVDDLMLERAEQRTSPRD